MNAFLPPRFGFVIKGEMGRIPVVGFLLRRIGSEFVERFDVSGSVRDARRLLKVADAGESLAFFPEGTFLHKPGLDRFRAGAFAVAINSNLPVVPIVIFGSRNILPAKTLMPRHGHLRLEVLNPIEPTDPAFENSKDLAELASPVFQVDRSDPPLLLLHGDQDPQMPINQAHELVGAYKQLGLDVTFDVVHGSAHGGRAFHRDEHLTSALDFLSRTIGR